MSYKIETTNKWYTHQSRTVTVNNDVTILWDMPIHNDNRLDIVIKNSKEKNCIIGI